MHLRRFAPPRENACSAVPRVVHSRAARSSSVDTSIDCVTLWDEMSRPVPMPIPAPGPVAGTPLEIRQRHRPRTAAGVSRPWRAQRVRQVCAPSPGGHFFKWSKRSGGQAKRAHRTAGHLVAGTQSR